MQNRPSLPQGRTACSDVHHERGSKQARTQRAQRAQERLPMATTPQRPAAGLPPRFAAWRQSTPISYPRRASLCDINNPCDSRSVSPLPLSQAGSRSPQTPELRGCSAASMPRHNGNRAGLLGVRRRFFLGKGGWSGSGSKDCVLELNRGYCFPGHRSTGYGFASPVQTSKASASSR